METLDDELLDLQEEGRQEDSDWDGHTELADQITMTLPNPLTHTLSNTNRVLQAHRDEHRLTTEEHNLLTDLPPSPDNTTTLAEILVAYTRGEELEEPITDVIATLLYKDRHENYFAQPPNTRHTFPRSIPGTDHMTYRTMNLILAKQFDTKEM